MTMMTVLYYRPNAQELSAGKRARADADTLGVDRRRVQKLTAYLCRDYGLSDRWLGGRALRVRDDLLNGDVVEQLSHDDDETFC